MKSYLIPIIAILLITGCDKSEKAAPEPAKEISSHSEATAVSKWGDFSLYEKSQKIIFNNELNSLNKHMIVITDAQSTHLVAKSETSDPILTFPELSFLPGKEYIARIKINSSASSELQLFFSVLGSNGYPFTEENSIRVPIAKGENEIYIQLTNKNLDKHLRMDPISTTGSFTISDITIKETE